MIIISVPLLVFDGGSKLLNKKNHNKIIKKIINHNKNNDVS